MSRTPLRSALRELSLDLAALVWPTACLACGAPDRDCCDACDREVRGWRSPQEFDIAGVPGIACDPYDGALRAALVAFKHDGRYGCRRRIAERFAPALRAAMLRSPEAPLIVPMPSRPRSVRRRGYHHLEVLIDAALRRSPVRAPRLRALRTTRGRSGQVGLSSADRERNARRISVRRSMANRVRGRPIVLVDDIVTTGASVRAARDVLEAAGARVVGVAVVCVAVRRDSLGDSAKMSSNL